jgi:hypothetical protein
MQVPLRVRYLLVPAALLALAVSAPAADVDKYLPNNTEAVQTINVRQLTDSALVKKNALEKIEKALKSNDEVQKVLKELGFDPLKDLDTYIQTTGGGDKVEDALYILHGKFDATKMHARAAKLAEDMPMMLKVSKVGDDKLYEFALPLPAPYDAAYVAMPDDKTIVGALSKDYILEVLDKKAGKKKTEIRKEVRDLIAKVDGKQTMWMVAFPDAYLKGPVKDLPATNEFRVFLEKADHLIGGMTVTDEIKGEATLVAKDAAAAKDLAALIDKGFTAAKNDPPPDAVGKAIFEAVLPNVKVATKDKVVTLTLNISNKDAMKAIDAIK